MLVYFTFMLPLLLVAGGILWLLLFSLRNKQFEMEKLIGLMILIAVLLGIVLLGVREATFLLRRDTTHKETLSELKDRYLEYGVGGDLITTTIGALLFAMVGLGTFGALKAKNEQQSREEKLNNSAKCIERLTQSKLYNESFDISKNLFDDIFKEFDFNKKIKLSDPICTAYLSNLEVYAQCRLEHGGIENELKNLIAVEKIHEELVQTLYQSTIWPSHRSSYEEGWKIRIRIFTNFFILGKRSDERHTVHTFLWHARFLNCWADVLIRLSRHVERERYLDQAETVLGWGRVGVFELADEEYEDGEIHYCLEFILERIRYHRLRGDLLHEKNHIAVHRDLTSYKNGLPNEEGIIKGLKDVEREYRLALSWISSLATFTTGRGDKSDVLPVWLDYKPNRSLSSYPPLSYYWEKNTAHPVDSLVRRLRERVISAKKGDSAYYLWNDIERCKCKSNKIRRILEHVLETDIKPKNAREPGMEDFLDDLQIETAKVYLWVAQISIRYIAEANEKNQFLPGNEYPEADILINRALGRARSLIEVELSWKHNILFYNNFGIYLTEKGRYEERLCNINQAEKLYETASRIHEMIQSHLIDGSEDVADITDQHDNDPKSEWYNEVDNLLYLRNLIDLGRVRQHLYRLRCDKQCVENCRDLAEFSKDFKATRRILLQALKISTKTENFICRAEAHLALAELYEVDRDNWGAAIIAYRSCLETFTEDEYKAYHEKVCEKLARFYAGHHEKIDDVQRTIFVKSFNLCDDFDNEDMCKRYRLKGNFHDHIRELIMRAPDECPEITCGRCSQRYWRDSP